MSAGNPRDFFFSGFLGSRTSVSISAETLQSLLPSLWDSRVTTRPHLPINVTDDTIKALATFVADITKQNVTTKIGNSNVIKWQQGIIRGIPIIPIHPPAAYYYHLPPESIVGYIQELISQLCLTDNSVTFNVFLNKSASLSSSGLQCHVLWERKNKPNAEPPISIVDNIAFHRPPKRKFTAENASNCNVFLTEL